MHENESKKVVTQTRSENLEMQTVDKVAELSFLDYSRVVA